MTCVWPVDPASCCTGWDDYSLPVRAAARITATEILFALSGRQFTGISLASAFPGDGAALEEAGYTLDGCTITVRPCRQHSGTACDSCGWPGSRTGSSWYAPWIPYLHDGTWYNASCGACGDTCACDGTLDELVLPGPVSSVSRVVVDGALFTDWALYDTATLVRTDGEPWPRCQNLGANLSDAGTWAVEYVRGLPVPVGGERAAGILACELAKACTGQKCRIPANVTEVTRDGVSYTFDPTVYYQSGLTGIPEVDLWLNAVNPGHNRRPSGIYSPQTITSDRVRRTPKEVWPTS
jgi:hypothetical protein